MVVASGQPCEVRGVIHIHLDQTFLDVARDRVAGLHQGQRLTDLRSLRYIKDAGAKLAPLMRVSEKRSRSRTPCFSNNASTSVSDAGLAAKELVTIHLETSRHIAMEDNY